MSTTTTTPTITASQKIILSKMLVAIDGSGASMDAADYAISISERYNSNFLLCMLYALALKLYIKQMKNIHIKTEIISSI